MIWIITIYGQFQKTDKPVMLCYMEWPWIVIAGIMIIERLCKIMAECIFCQRKEKQGTNMKLQQLMSYTRRAIDDYSLIEEGDHIAVGISGGKDSLSLLYSLAGLRRFYPHKFQLSAIMVNLGFGHMDLSKISELCQELEVPFYEVKSEIGKIIFEDRKESNPCSLCAKMRKGALNTRAKEIGCNKVAYAHHKDDFVETVLLSLIFEGHFYVFPPKTYLDRMDLTVIRPFLYLEERDIVGFCNKYDLPVQKNPCPADGHTKREYAKNLVHTLDREHPGARDRIFHAILSSDLKGYGNMM